MKTIKSVIEVRHIKGNDYALRVEGTSGITEIAGYAEDGQLYYHDDPTVKTWIEFPTKRDGSPSRVSRRGILMTADKDNVWIHRGRECSSYDVVNDHGYISGTYKDIELNDRELKYIDKLSLWVEWHMDNTKANEK